MVLFDLFLLRQFVFFLLLPSFLQAVVWPEHEVNRSLFKTGAQSVVVIDLAREELIFTKDSSLPFYPASTMKVATLLLAYEKLADRLDEEIVITKEMVASIAPSKKRDRNYSDSPHLIEMGSSHMGLKIGELIKIRDLFSGAMIASANDACNALATCASGHPSLFVKELNLYVKKIGCKGTNFVNVHGLHHPKQVTTARDLARIALTCTKTPFLLSLAKEPAFRRPKTNLQEPATYAQTNTLLRRSSSDYYDKAYGLKTGYTQDAGAHILALAKDSKRHLLVIALGCGLNSKEKAREIFDFFFQKNPKRVS